MRWRPTLFSIAISVALVVPARAGVITVCPAGCDQTLVQAAINAADPGDTIQIAVNGEHTEAEIVASKSVTIEGIPPLGTTYLQADEYPEMWNGRVLTVAEGATVVLRDLILQHGATTGHGGGVANFGSLTLERAIVWQSVTSVGNGGAIFNATTGSLYLIDGSDAASSSATAGGGIYNAGSLWLDSSFIEGNGGTDGGGLWNEGVATLVDSQIVANESDGEGAGVYNSPEGELTLARAKVWLNDLVSPGSFGGGIANYGDLLLVGTEVVSNTIESEGCGAGIYQGLGTLTGYDSAILYCDWTIYEETGNGGGICILDGSVELIDSRVDQNRADKGGGVFVTAQGTLVLRRSSVLWNVAETDGGGLYLLGDGEVGLTNVTVSGNVAREDGGGIWNGIANVPHLANVTMSLNEAAYGGTSGGDGGGIYSTGFMPVLANTLIAGNLDHSPMFTTRAHDCYGALSSLGYSLIGTLGTTAAGPAPCSVSGGTGNQIGIVDPGLGELAENGGRTRTQALELDSPARNAGNPAGCLDPDGLLIGSDQRGIPRGALCDIGAYEISTESIPLFTDGFELGFFWRWSESVP